MSARERVIQLPEGELAPPGTKIVRMLGHMLVPTGAGTNTRMVWIVVVSSEAPGETP